MHSFPRGVFWRRPQWYSAMRYVALLPRWVRKLYCQTTYDSFIHQWLYSPLLGPGLFFSVVIFFYTDGRTPWTSDQPAVKPLPTHRTAQTQNKLAHRHSCPEWDYYMVTCYTMQKSCFHRAVPKRADESRANKREECLYFVAPQRLATHVTRLA
jgi:hypothetical protein